MNDLVERLVANVGVEREIAEKAVGIIFDFLSKEGPQDKVQSLIDRMPGIEAAIAAAREGDGGGGLFGSMGGIMGVGSRLMAIGLSMNQIQTVTRETIAYAREQGNEEELGEIVSAIPGLSQFV